MLKAMTLKQIRSELEQLQLALDEHVDHHDHDSLERAAARHMEEARSLLHTAENLGQPVDPLVELEEELEAIANRYEDEEDGREVYDDFRERAFTRGLG